MKFYSLLTVFGVLGARFSLSAGHAAKQLGYRYSYRMPSGSTTTTPTPKTEEEADRELEHKACIFGEKPRKVVRVPPPGAKYTPGYRVITVECTKAPFETEWQSPDPSRSAPKTDEELNKEMKNLQCPFGKRSAMMAPMCPIAAKDRLDCPPIEVVCVPKFLGTVEISLKSGGQESATWTLTEMVAKIEMEMVGKECTDGQRPVQISLQCPKGAKDPFDCTRIEIWCVREALDIVDTDEKPIRPASRKRHIIGAGPQRSIYDDEVGFGATEVPATASKTMDELYTEMKHMICPHNHSQTLILGSSRTNSRLSGDYSTIRLACRPQFLGNDSPLTTNTHNTYSGEIDHEVHPWGRYRNGVRIRPWSG